MIDKVRKSNATPESPWHTQSYPDTAEEVPQLSLITHEAVESADQIDANALLPAFEDSADCDMVPEECLADSLYGSDDNCEKALDQFGVTVIAPAMPGNRKKIPLCRLHPG